MEIVSTPQGDQACALTRRVAGNTFLSRHHWTLPNPHYSTFLLMGNEEQEPAKD